MELDIRYTFCRLCIAVARIHACVIHYTCTRPSDLANELLSCKCSSVVPRTSCYHVALHRSDKQHPSFSCDWACRKCKQRRGCCSCLGASTLLHNCRSPLVFAIKHQCFTSIIAECQNRTSYKVAASDSSRGSYCLALTG